MSTTEQPSRRDSIIAVVVGLLMVVASPFIVALICGPVSVTEFVAATIFAGAAVAFAAWLIS
jgi:hypothetical protein